MSSNGTNGQQRPPKRHDKMQPIFSVTCEGNENQFQEYHSKFENIQGFSMNADYEPKIYPNKVLLWISNAMYATASYQWQVTQLNCG